MCYVNCTKDVVLRGCTSDKPSALQLAVYSDADFAGCQETSRSTSRLLLAFAGPGSFFSLACISKRQSCVSHSTPEAGG